MRKRTIKSILTSIRRLPGQRELREALRADAVGAHARYVQPVDDAGFGLFRLGQQFREWSRTHKRRYGRKATLADWFTENAGAWHKALCEAGRALAAFETVYAGAGVHTDRLIAQGWEALDDLATLYVGSEPLPRSPADEAALQRMYSRVMEAVSTALGPLQPGDGADIADAVEQWLGGGQ